MLPITRTVLVADDDFEVRRGVSELLAALDLEILEAETGPEALRIARQRELRAMVLDVHMPGFTGLEVLDALREEIAVPCIVCTGRPTLELERRALDAGAWAFLRKPVRPDLLRQEVRRAVDSGMGGRRPQA